MGDEKRYERVFHVSPISMSLTTLREGRFIDVNGAMERITGYTRDETIGHTSVEMGIWVDPEVARAVIVADLAANGVVRDRELLMRLKSGEQRIFLMGAAVIEDPAEPLMMAGFQDVTERYRLDEALRQSEARYRRFIEDLPLGVVVTQQGVIRFTNATARTLLGFSADELHGKPFLPFVLEEDRAWLVDLHQRRMRGEDVPTTYECRFATKSGEVRHWSLDTRTIDWDGTAAIATVTDNTETRRTQSELKLAASVFAQASEAIVITDADATVIAVNDSFTRLTGYSREDVVGRDATLFRSPQQDLEFYANRRRVLEERGEWRGELWIQRKGGGLFAVSESISRVQDLNGAVSHYVALFSDITEAKRHQQQLEHLAHFDFLTSLPNRVLLADRLQQAMVQNMQCGQSLAVVYLDLDGFKAVNDLYGHDTGDRSSDRSRAAPENCIA
ncbi:bifunctional diguanylate cyclase/phosphodiesterase [Rhodoferax sp. PAMC 29310]|uniref:sensor domain-containing protein n=1 Tax=Rhodoferax sp. PAMC 29310 TaxID=2822760 RepID=UPI001B31A3A5|nr:PAS domain S-box protein [Rhodoferax sp. PAMC 29310]